MAKITVYLPDDLRDQVKSAHVNVSAVCQEALRWELVRNGSRIDVPSLLRLAIQELEKDW